MGLTDDPLYRKLIEGDDNQILVGTLTVPGPRPVVFPLFLVDYHGTPDDLEGVVADTFDDTKQINLNVQDRAYSVDLGERNTMILFSEGETAAHTASNFWAQFTAEPPEHKAFQEAYARTQAWMFVVITKKMLREFLVHPNGAILFKRTRPLDDDLRKMFGVT